MNYKYRRVQVKTIKCVSNKTELENFCNPDEKIVTKIQESFKMPKDKTRKDSPIIL